MLTSQFVPHLWSASLTTAFNGGPLKNKRPDRLVARLKSQILELRQVVIIVNVKTFRFAVLDLYNYANLQLINSSTQCLPTDGGRVHSAGHGRYGRPGPDGLTLRRDPPP